MPAFDTGRRVACLAAGWAVATALTLLAPPRATAAPTTSYSGIFTADDELWALPLSLPQAGVLDARTLSYSGGVGATAGAVAAGGFAPVLSLFDSGGMLLQLISGTAQACGGGAVDPFSGLCWDAALSASLAAGDYTLVLSQDGNLPLGPTLADGFSMSGSPDYTGWTWLGAGGLRFVNPDLSTRDGHWALDVSVAASVPEPMVGLLLAAALVAWAAQAGTARLRRSS